MKGLKQFGTLKPKCHRMDGWIGIGIGIGISPDRSISRSPSGDNKGVPSLPGKRRDRKPSFVDLYTTRLSSEV